jgi:hypothetical protein
MTNLTNYTKSRLGWIFTQIIISSFNLILLLHIQRMSSRGLGLNDESYYIISAINSKNVNYFVSAQHLLLDPIWQISGNITFFRIFGATCLILSAISLGFALSKICINLKPTLALVTRLKIVIVNLTVTGSLLYASTINLSPSYNLIGAAVINLAAGASLKFFFLNHTNFFTLKLILASIILLLLKPPSVLAFLIWLILLSVLFGRFRENFWFFARAYLITLSVISVLIVLFSSFENVVFALNNGNKLFKLVQTETFNQRLFGYFVDLSFGSMRSILFFLPSYLCGYLFLRYKKVKFAVFSLSSFFVIYVIMQLRVGVEFNLTLTSTALSSFLYLTILLNYRTLRSHKELRILILSLSLLPYVSSFGTGNSIFTQVVTSLAPWGAVVAINLFSLNSRIKEKNSKYLIGHRTISFNYLLIFSLLVTVPVMLTFYSTPYGLSTSYQHQSNKTKIGSIGSILVDRETIKLKQSIDSAVRKCGIPSGVNFISLYNSPGLAIFFEASPRLTPWVNNYEQFDFLQRGDGFLSLPLVVAVERGSDLQGVNSKLLAVKNVSLKFCGSAINPQTSQSVDFWYYSLTFSNGGH